jgi:hypothetical protein
MSNEITLNGTVYIPKSEAKAEKKNNMPYCIVRTHSAGVFAGYVESRDGQEVVVRDARRLWYWEGANSLSQLAVDGTSKPANCKFPVAVDKIMLTQAIEIIDCTETAKKSIMEVKIWDK